MSSYYAIAAKVHALYGRRMKHEDYRQLMTRRTIPEAAVFLQNHPGYRDRLAGINTQTVRREQLENALRGSFVDEYRRIFRFMNLTDKELLRFPMYRAEISAILSAMSRLNSIHALDPVTTWDALLNQESTLELEALERATSFQDIADAGRNTIFGSALARIAAGENKEPTHAFVDNMLQVVYFARLYKTMGKNYTGDTRKLIKQSLDQETDLINLVQFLRLKKYFTPEDIALYAFPLPCSPRLSKESMQQLLAAPDYASARALVNEGGYGKLFRSLDDAGLEAYLYTLQYNFSIKCLRSAEPTVYTPIAYITLKEIEVRSLISIIECIRYGGDPNDYVTLIGV